MDVDNKIFGSEAEPLFNLKSYCLSADILEDWLYILASENYGSDRKTLRNVHKGYFKCGVSVELLFRICDLLKQSPEVKYHSAELFDLFMYHHIIDLWKQTAENNTQQEIRRTEWNAVLSRIRNQVVLRMLTCIQIASKLYYSQKCVTISEMMVFIRKLGYSFRKKSFLNSELRVLNSLRYKVNVTTPLVYVETLLESLGRNDSTLNIKGLYDVSLNVMDITYLKRNDIYHRLFMRITGKSQYLDDDNKVKYQSVKDDQLFLAATIIASASYILIQYSYNQTVEQLNYITRIPTEELVQFANVLIGIINI